MVQKIPLVPFNSPETQTDIKHFRSHRKSLQYHSTNKDTKQISGVSEAMYS